MRMLVRRGKFVLQTNKMKKKRLFPIIFTFMMAILLVGCNKVEDDQLIIELKANEISIKIGEKYSVDYETNDEEGVVFESSDLNIATVSEEGVVEGLGLGIVTIKVISKSDSTVFKTIEITVESSGVEEISIVLAEGMTKDLGYTKKKGYSFEVGNQYVANINDEGMIEGFLTGTTEIVVMKDENEVAILKVDVLGKARTFRIKGQEEIYYDEVVKIDVEILPLRAYQEFEFIIDDESVLSIDENGVVTPLKAGTTKVTALSLQGDDTKDEITITVRPVILVSNSNEDNLEVGNYNFIKGQTMFGSLSEAINKSSEGMKVLLKEYTETEEVTIDKSVIITGDNGKISNKINIDTTDLVVFRNINFDDDAEVTTTEKSELLIDNIVAKDINTNDFINLNDVENLTIVNSEFNNLNNALLINNISSNSKVLIQGNNFTNIQTGIKVINVGSLSTEDTFKVYRNKIDGANEAFNVTLDEVNDGKKLNYYARFNEVENYEKAVVNNGPSLFEFTFNYWGNYDKDDFYNIDEKMIIANYENKDDILSESIYNPEVPILVRVTNAPEVIELGDEYMLDFETLPYTADNSRYSLTLSNLQIVEFIDGRILKPIRSGILEIEVASYSNLSDVEVHKIELTTDPGIRFELSDDRAGLQVGDEITIKALPFPYNLEDEDVTFTTSDSSVATIDNEGVLTVVGVGEFDVIASLTNDPAVSQVLPLASYGEFDENSIMDLYIQSQINYSKMFDITFHGVSIATGKLSEPVTRLIADDVERHEKIIPVTPGFRPGVKFNSNIPEEFKYNEDNVVWIVVHDTGNSNVRAGAKMHADYLYNAALNNGREASWHFTVDPYEIYQSMPLDEVAYHAGDGSRLPALGNVSPALGGGNRNGIGIEMSIERDGDIFKTWQNTARLVAELLHTYNLPLSHITYHNDFSGKECPQTLRRAGLLWLFEEYAANEYKLKEIFGENDSVEIISKNPDILSNTGQIVNIPDRSTIVEYDIVVTQNGVTTTQTFKTLVEGMFR